MDRIYVFEEIDSTKSNNSHKCVIYYYLLLQIVNIIIITTVHKWIVDWYNWQLIANVK